jgi:Spy/CpxP family protein refolding chaperone
MKINKLSFAVLAAAGLLALSIPAQADDTNAAPATPKPPAAGGPPGMRGPRMSVDQRLSQLSDSHTLTDDQKPKVKALLEDQQKQMADLRQAAPEDRRAKMQALRDDMNTKMKDILTPDQYDKFSKMTPPGRRPGGPGAPGAGGASTNAPATQ